MGRRPGLLIFLGALVVSIIVISAVVGYGVFYVWYKSTGFREQNQPSFKPQEILGYLPLPSGSIPTKGKEPEVETPDQARLLENPIAPTSRSLEIGKDLFLTYCAPCHGRSGEGMGLMGAVPNLAPLGIKEDEDLTDYLSGYLGYSPDLDLNWVQRELDGELYFTITNGGQAIMPSFRDAMNPEQRWHLINYIKRGLGGSFGI